MTKTEKDALAAKKRVKAWVLYRNWLLCGSMGLKFYAAAPIGLVVLVSVGSLFLTGWRGVQEGGQGGLGIARVLRGVSCQVKHRKKSEVELCDNKIYLESEMPAPQVKHSKGSPGPCQHRPKSSCIHHPKPS